MTHEAWPAAVEALPVESNQEPFLAIAGELAAPVDEAPVPRTAIPDLGTTRTPPAAAPRRRSDRSEENDPAVLGAPHLDPPSRAVKAQQAFSSGAERDAARAQSQRTRLRRGWLFPSPGRRSPTGLLPGAQPAKTIFTTKQDHRRLRSRQKSGCLRGQARGTANRTPPPNRQPAGRQTPSFPEPGPPEAPLTLTSSRQNNRQEPTVRQVQAAARVEDDRREDDSHRPRSGANVGVAQRESDHQRQRGLVRATARSAA